MGRKIPAKKHHGVKDPLKQQAKRLQSLKGKINAPPKDPDEQPVPRSVTRLFAFQDTIKNKRKKKKNGPKDNFQLKIHEKAAADNPISKMRQLPGESGRGFSLRINSAIRALNESAEQRHYPPDLEAEEDAKGERMEAQRRRRERKRRGKHSDEPKLSRAQRLALKKKEKKMKEAEKREEPAEVRYERVGFGEVAHAPPALHFKPKKLAGTNLGAPRPGRRDLLLTGMLKGANQSPGAGAGAGAGAGVGAGAGAGRVRQRARALPAAERMRRERARQAAVDAYRALRARSDQDDKSAMHTNNYTVNIL